MNKKFLLILAAGFLSLGWLTMSPGESLKVIEAAINNESGTMIMRYDTFVAFFAGSEHSENVLQCIKVVFVNMENGMPLSMDQVAQSLNDPRFTFDMKRAQELIDLMENAGYEYISPQDLPFGFVQAATTYTLQTLLKGARIWPIMLVVSENSTQPIFIEVDG